MVGGKTNNKNGKIGSATITVSGGDILGQFVMAGGAGAGQNSEFTMSGGTISNSRVNDEEYYHVQKNGGAVYLEVGEVKLSGNAEISSNLARKGNGGAIYITAGNFFMGDGKPIVTYNSALGKGDESVGNGGGIYVTSQSATVNVEVLSGVIEHNTSDGNGGGLCVDMPSTGVDANIKIGEDGSSSLVNPNIQRNQSVMYGGGLYAKGKNAKITINSGVIMNNSVSNYVPNEDVYNDMGIVVLNGGEVTHVIVTFNANAPDDETAKLDGAKTATQKIVKNTNSFLVQPKNIYRSFYIFKGWNTRPDGKGTFYSYDDVEAEKVTMNLKEDLTLYAQWKLDK